MMGTMILRRLRCQHRRVRCIHGDEIIARMGMFAGIRVRMCLDCGRALPGPRPRVCTVTGQPHAR